MKCMNDRNIWKISSNFNEVKFDALLCIQNYTMRVTMSEAINLLFLINRYIQKNKKNQTIQKVTHWKKEIGV